MLIVTDEKPSKSPDFALMGLLSEQLVIRDGRNVSDPEWVRASGVDCFFVVRARMADMWRR